MPTLGLTDIFLNLSTVFLVDAQFDRVSADLSRASEMGDALVTKRLELLSHSS